MPILLTEVLQQQPAVARCCAEAYRSGVRMGMNLHHARALLDQPPLLRPHAPQQDAAALRSLGHWAMRFTPIVVVDEPDGLLLDIAGCEHLFGGETKLLERVQRSLEALGFAARIAIAPTIGCAWAVCRFAKVPGIIGPREILRSLDPLPVQALRIEDSTVAALADVAVDRVGQLFALPRKQLADRFGSAVLLRMDQATGDAFEPVTPLTHRLPLFVVREFAGPVRKIEAITQTVQQLLQQLGEQLLRQQRGVRKLRLTLHRTDAQAVHESLTLSRPTRDVRHLWKVLSPRIEKVNMGWGVEKVLLHATHTSRLPPQQSEAWPGMTAKNEPMDQPIAELIDLLTQRLGADHVCRWQPAESHVPECVFGLRSWREGDAMHEADVSQVRFTEADRPTQLLDRPERVEVVAMMPEGPVVGMRHRGRMIRIIRSIGPERIACRWWLMADADSQQPPRDYYKLQDDQGQWWWAYRKVGTGRWFVHGRWV